MDFAAQMGLGEEGVEFRESFSAHMRTIDRQLQNEVNENNTRRGNTDTYDHTR